MWRVIALDKDGHEIVRIDLGAGELTIGRDPDRQIQLASASVSRRHARFVVNGAQVLVIDDGSANGVVVNGVRISAPTPIDPRARIEIAEFRLVLESLVADATPSVAPYGSNVVPESLRLVAQGGPYDGRVFPVVGELMVGRAAENQIVLDDPSLSRKHARLIGTGHHLDVEDQGSSNGTFINGRKIGHATAGPGDSIRFGELSFRIEDEHGQGRPGSESSLGQTIALIGAGGVTLIILLTAFVVLLRKPPSQKASGKDSIAKISVQAEQHMRLGKQLFTDKKWADAKTELDATIELDPANIEARRMKGLASRAPEDERNLSSALAALAIGDRKALETTLRLRDELSQGAPAREQLDEKLSARLVQFGLQRFDDREYGESAWALCRAFELAPAMARADARVVREIREAEKKLIRDRTYVACRAAK